METNNPPSPHKSPRTRRSRPENPPVTNPLSREDREDFATPSRPFKTPNKYAPKERIGKPTIGRPANYVTRVGLGNLKTITADASDYQP